MISVVNIKTYSAAYYYIGRPLPLGNPYKIGTKYKRGETLDLYKKWLWREINKENSITKTEFLKLADIAKAQDLVLGCWYKQQHKEIACHGDIIKAAIEWRNNVK